MGQEELRPEIGLQGIVEVECPGPAPGDISVGTIAYEIWPTKIVKKNSLNFESNCSVKFYILEDN